MSKQRKPVIERYLEGDIADVIGHHFETVQSPEGARFYSHHTVDGTLILRCGMQTFIITVTEKEKIN